MSLQLNDELLSAFLDGEVTAEERQQIETQLAASPEWQKRYRQLVETVNQVRTLPQQPMPKDFSAGILAQIAQRQQSEKGATSSIPAASEKVSPLEAKPVPLATAPRGSQSERLRKKKSDRVSPVWMALAACVVLAIGLGIVFQAGIFDGKQTPVAVDDSPKNTDHDPVAVANNDRDPIPPEVAPTNNFPTVEELANHDVGNPPVEGMDGTPEEKSPIRVRVNVRTKPNVKESMPETRVRPPALARSVFNLDQGDDPGLDQQSLLPLDDPAVTTELVSWIDSDGDESLSDSEMQQAWLRFSTPDMQAPAISEPALKLIDRDMNEKISSAEFHLAIASVRWNNSAELRRIYFRLDANGDGVWSAEDFNDNARFAPSPAALRREVAQWHSVLDRSHDGNVSRVEFSLSAGHMQLSLRNWERTILNPQVYEKTQRLVAEFDRDSNGQLAGREIRRMIEARPEVKTLLEGADQSGVSGYELYLLIESNQF